MDLRAANVEDIYPFSPLQQGLLFHGLRDPQAGMFFQQSVQRRENVDVAAFRQAWQSVVDRHAVLRTSFHWEGLDKPLQVVSRRVSVPFVDEDWRALAPAEQEQRLQAYLQTDRQRGFLLTEAPLMRVALFRLTDSAYRYIWSHHHLLLDGWSIPVLLKDLSAFYEAFCQGRDLSLAPARPFREYIAWLQRQDLARAEAFWRRNLRGFTSPTEVPRDGTGGSPASGQPLFADQMVELSPALTVALHSLTRQQGLTLNALMQAAWALLLRHYTGQDDILFGATVSGRPADLPGVESMVGLFINTLPIRVQVRGREPLLTVLRRLQAEQAERMQYEYSPLMEVKRWSEVPPQKELFETLFTFENLPSTRPANARGRGARPARPPLAVQQTNFPLMLVILPHREAMPLQLIYATSHFEAATVGRMLGHLQTVLEGLAGDLGRCVGDLPLLSADERRLVLHEWNPPATAYPQDQCLHQLFEQQAARTPEAIALSFEDRCLTYDELNRRANRLARHLRTLGVGLESPVGVCLERSPEMVVGVLGILKAGGAYVPLDPTYPRERLGFMLADSGAAVLLTQERLATLLPGDGLQVVHLDADGEAFATQSDANLGCPVAPDNLAYVIYTSGSTGTPKGVLGTHRATVNRCAWMWRTYPFAGGEVACQKTALSFVDSVWEVFGPLLQGVRTVILPDAVVKDALQMVRALAAAGVTRLVLVPSLLRSLLETGLGLGASLPQLRVVVCSGEALPLELAERFRREAPGVILLNLYGSSEVAADVTCHEVQSGGAQRTVPIGRPLANTRAYILDRRLQPVAIGVAGDLYIAGAGLARGYHGRPDLTVERFLADPFGPEPGGRLYATGDRARWLNDGNIEYLGRADYQVKVRGFRIELGEVEKALAACPAVQQAAVVVREVVPGDLRLIAYVTGRNGAEAGAAELQAFVRRRLPEHMVPSTVVLLPELPQTPSGKLDRRALLALGTEAQQGQQEYVAPRNPTEETLAGLWSQVLGVRQVGLHDNFFQLGGHSLLATRVISQVRLTLGVEVPLRALFEAPTVAGLAGAIDMLRLQGSGPPVPPLQPVPRTDDLPLSFAQQRLWFLDQWDPGSAAYNMPGTFPVRGPLDLAALGRAISEVVRRHESLRTTFPAVAGRPVQRIAPAGPVELPIHDLSQLPPHERQAAARRLRGEEVRRPFDLAAGPLLRASLLRLGPEQHTLLLNTHHIVFDLWSQAVLLGELSTLYRAFRAGQPSPLPEPALQYADYAVWQQQWLQGETLQQQLDYWRKRLAGAATLALPTDKPRPPRQGFRGAVLPVRLPADLTERLKELGRRRGTTLFMTLLAGFQVLLGRYSGQTDVTVGTPIAGRSRRELEGLIGFFVNTLVLRTDLSGDPSFVGLLQRVREVCLGGYAHQDMPFDRLVEELQPQRDPSRNPLFQVVFILQNMPQDSLQLTDQQRPAALAGNRAAQQADGAAPGALQQGGNGTSRFDLALQMYERPEGLHGMFKYSTDLFEEATIARMARHLEIVLQAIADDPERPLSQIALVSEKESAKLLQLSSAGQAEAAPAGGNAAEEMLQQVEQLSDDAIDAMLKNMLEQEGVSETGPDTLLRLAASAAEANGAGEDDQKLLESVRQISDEEVDALLRSALAAGERGHE